MYNKLHEDKQLTYYEKNRKTESVGEHIQRAEWIKTCHPRNIYLEKQSFKKEGKIKTFSTEQKLRELIVVRLHVRNTRENSSGLKQGTSESNLKPHSKTKQSKKRELTLLV